MSKILIEGTQIEIGTVLVPWRLSILLDVSLSMKEENRLGKAKEGIKKFLYNVSQKRGNPNDWVTASCFSGYSTKDGKLYYRIMDAFYRIAFKDSFHSIMEFINNWEPVGYGTALYDSIAIASYYLQELVKELGSEGINTVIAITDGEDNSSKIEPSKIGYPNPYLHLALIGVGSKALTSLSNLKPYATSTDHINNFEDLYYSMFKVLGVIVERHFSCEV